MMPLILLLTLDMASIVTTSLQTRLINQRCGLKPRLDGLLRYIGDAVPYRPAEGLAFSVLNTRTVQVQQLSDPTTEREIHEFFYFSGEIERIQIQRDPAQSKTAFVTFKDAKALEIALLLSVCTQNALLSLGIEVSVPSTKEELDKSNCPASIFTIVNASANGLAPTSDGAASLVLVSGEKALELGLYALVLHFSGKPTPLVLYHALLLQYVLTREASQ
ncbi:uncharacterized protein LOC121051054 [Rosa chinensis]|uniref:uncharacterized protein LOC121051054 n=1 Tax=Rosa chinensis TaxID=74649 RepID=UPI001AD8D915|nr:uncharacterized protein LOC121051054 [Rosa chinensis]